MEPIHVKLQLLKEVYGAADAQALKDPTHPFWSLYDSFHAVSEDQVLLPHFT